MLDLMSFFSTPELWVFFVSAGILGALFVAEILSFVLSGGFISGFFEHLEADFDVDSGFDFSDWLNIGRVPLSIILVGLLMGFTISGLSLQLLAENIVGSFVSNFIAVPLATVGGLFMAKGIGGIFAKVFSSKNETTAISTSTFIGRVVTISVGIAEKGSPAQAKFTDEYGQTHYVMVEPLNEGESFSEGEEVILQKESGHFFLGNRKLKFVLSSDNSI